MGSHDGLIREWMELGVVCGKNGVWPVLGGHGLGVGGFIQGVDR